MKIDHSKISTWIKTLDNALPGLEETLSDSATEVLLIGAVVFDFYSLQGWIPPLKRKTGDLDLSIGLVGNVDNYEKFKSKLLSLGYTTTDHPYRFYPKRRLPDSMYIDLLAHPVKSITAETVRNAIGAGPGFTFEGMSLAQKHGFKITPKVLCPNPVSMVGLKMVSYRDEPAKRIKDLADIAELAFGIVGNAQHFEMEEIWNQMKADAYSQKIRDVMAALGGGRSTDWDLGNAESELLKRNFTLEEIEETIPASLSDWAEALTD